MWGKRNKKRYRIENISLREVVPEKEEFFDEKYFHHILIHNGCRKKWDGGTKVCAAQVMKTLEPARLSYGKIKLLLIILPLQGWRHDP